jgi:hypothetical protein
MEPGIEAQYVRCRRCHSAFESTLTNCPRCGMAYQAVAAVQAETSSYADRYQGTEFAEAPVAPAPVAPRRRRNAAVFLALGTALVVTAIAVSSLVIMGALDVATPVPTSNNIVVTIATPTPVPTMPPAIGNTLDTLSDPNLNLHVAIRTTVTVNAKVTGHAYSASVSVDVDCAEGNESGTTKTGSLATRWWLVEGTYYSVGLDSRGTQMGKPKAQAGMSPVVIMSPMFQLTDTKMLQYDGEEQQAGIMAEKLETTDWWVPDTEKMSGIDVGTLGISPAHTKLIVWTDSSGEPVYATFRAWTDASDGTNLLNIATTYEFSQVGTVQPIEAPV